MPQIVVPINVSCELGPQPISASSIDTVASNNTETSFSLTASWTTLNCRSRNYLFNVSSPAGSESILVTNDQLTVDPDTSRVSVKATTPIVVHLSPQSQYDYAVTVEGGTSAVSSIANV